MRARSLPHWPRAARSGEWQGLPDFAALLENLFSTRAASAAHPVQVMTIHRAKGLEFEHVFVPALDRLTRAGERAAAALDRPAQRRAGPTSF